MNDSPRTKLPGTRASAAGPLCYVALLALLAKLARVLELSLRSGSSKPWALLPVTIGQDLMLIAGAGLVGILLSRVRRPWLRIALSVVPLLPIGLLLPSDVLAHMLTGRPITIQRLRGEEGATLKDLHLLARADLIGGVLGITAALLLLWAALRYAPRIALARRWARPRPLFLTLLLGCGLSLAQAAFVPRTQGLAEQPVFVLAGSFVHKNELAPLSLTDSQFQALKQPDVEEPAVPAPKVMARPKNVVLFLAEGVPFKATGFDPRFNQKKAKKRKEWPNPTPNLIRRYNESGMLFDRYYANWHASIQAIFSIVCSAFPPMTGDIVRVKPRIDCGELSQILKAHGVTPGLFHSGEFNFYNKLALLGRRGNAIELDAEELRKTSPRASHEWGIDDRAMTDATLSWVDSLPKSQPFFALLIAVTPHYPYWVPRDFNRPYKTNGNLERFLDGVAFQDQVFEDLLHGFEERGLYDDTLFIWLGDHGHYVGEPERATPGLREFYEANLHVALVMINSKMFPSSLTPAERVNSRLSSHEDLMPTILDALGMKPDPRHQGRSLFAKVRPEQRIYFGAEEGRFVGFIQGHEKFAIDIGEKRTEYYDLASDPDEHKDLSERYPDRMTRYGEDAILFARGSQARIAAAPVLNEKVSVNNAYELFLQHANVQLEHDGKEEACTKGPNAVCPGLGPVARIDTKVILGDQRRCVMLKVPTQGSVEFSVKNRDTLDLLTGTIVALPRPPGLPKPPRVRVETYVDGKRVHPVQASIDDAPRVYHPKAHDELRFSFSLVGPPSPKPVEVCLQLTALL